MKGGTMSEFVSWLEQAVFEVETGRASAQQIRTRLFSEWGGVRVVMPRYDPQQREEIRGLVELGTAERTARRVVRGK
jgi:hypothetical protein